MQFEEYAPECFGIYCIWVDTIEDGRIVEKPAYVSGLNAWECSNIQQPLTYEQTKKLYEEGELSHIFQ